MLKFVLASVLGASLFCGYSISAESAQAIPNVSPTATLAGDGVFVVGSAVRPSTYRSTNNAATSCYWARLSGFSGTLADIIANEYGSGPQIVTISPSDSGFDTSNCGSWVLLSKLPAKVKNKIVGDGVFSVAKQIRPGTYQSSNSSSASCYWARLSGFSGTLADIIANDYASGPRIVAISGSDKGFSSSGCGTWTRQ